jgi:stearoyl-CoA desaturase (delta-9 desaturase)
MIAAKSVSPPAAGGHQQAWRRGILPASRKIRRMQRVHALLLTMAPLVGTLVAGKLALDEGVGGLDVILLVGMYTLTIAGVTVGFHRHFAHLAFKAGPGVRVALGIMGSMAAQGPLLYWVANHRRHHHYSDHPGDPHSPRFDGERELGGLSGFWHAHVEWNFAHDLTNAAVYCKDLLRDPLVARINKRYYLWVLLGLLLPALVGGAVTQSMSGAVSGFLWGGLVRLFFSYHATSGINSIAHAFGSRPFATREQSRNNLLLVLPTLGEGWHNNHHAFPTSAAFGLKPTQLDLGWLVIRALQAFSLVWDVRTPTERQIATRNQERDPEMTSMPGASEAEPATSLSTVSKT